MNEENKKIKKCELQQILLDILKKYSSICEEKNFDYYLYAGTLLGAIRHKGFIPWDDDIDVLMPRRSYEQFINYCVDQEKKLFPYKLIHYSNTKTTSSIARFNNMMYKKVFLDNIKDCDQGISISIFPIDSGGNSIKKCIRKMKIGKTLQKLILISRYNTFVLPKNKFLTIPKIFIYYLTKLIGTKRLIKIIDSYAKKHNQKTNKYYCKYIWGKTVWFSEEELIKTKTKFGNEEFVIPSGYDKILKRMYGEYMLLPSTADRTSFHNYEYYKREEQSN